MSFLESFFSLSELETFAQEIAIRSKVFPEGGKVFFLFGDLGSGKTTFSQFFTSTITEKKDLVSSPTFSYVHTYQAGEIKILHCDFYRAPPKRIPEILNILEDANTNDILLLEWPTEEAVRLLQHVPSLSITFSHLSKNIEKRKIHLSFSNPWNIIPIEAKKIWEEFATPEHVRGHIEKVRRVAVFCANALHCQNIPIDREIVESAAILHDAVRYIDFRNFEDFIAQEQSASPQTIALWRELYKKYDRMHHADAIGEILESRGYFATAKVSRAHNTSAIYRKEPFSWEEKVVYYADKRALHNTIVSLKDRLEDGRRRYHHEKTTGLEGKILQIEAEIFQRGNINPEEIFLL